jgi:shikimate dehydrogenase
VPVARPTYAVIGDPIEHSLSPRLFAWLFGELGIDAHFTALRVSPAELPEAVGRLRRGLFAGLAVTLPHKEAILPLLDDVHPAARRIGAVNVAVRDPAGRVRGHNTDGVGFRLALEAAGGRPGGARVVLLGAGGAARAAAFTLVGAGAKSVAIANRSPKRAVRLALELVEAGAHPEADLRRRWEAGERPPPRPGLPPPAQPPDLAHPAGRPFVTALPLEARALAAPLAHADVVVNATSVGLMDPAADPLPAGLRLEPRHVVLDMVYRPLETALLARARAAGATPVDGLWMLAHQALEALRLFTGRAAPGLAPSLHDVLAREAR